VTNESAPQSRRRVRVPIGVAYGTDIDEFEALAVEAALAEPLVLDSPKPRARLRSFGDSALQYEILCWVNGPTRRRRAQHTLNRALYKTLSAADIDSVPQTRRDGHRGGRICHRRRTNGHPVIHRTTRNGDRGR